MPDFLKFLNETYIYNTAAVFVVGILIFRKVKQILAEVKPNGGKSLADTIKRIETSLIASIHWNIIFQYLYNEPLFRTDNNGEYEWVNNSYLTVAGIGLEDVKGKRWLSIVTEEDRHRVRDEWCSCVTDKRVFDLTFQIKNLANDRTYNVRGVAYPNLVGGELQGYFGALHFLSEK